MKSNIHPNWHQDTKVVCSCGNTFTTGSSLDEIRVEICSACHPFFTGEMRFVDVQGRVEKFQAKQKMAAQRKQVADAKAKTKKQKQQEDPKSLKEMLTNIKEQTKQAASPTKH